MSEFLKSVAKAHIDSGADLADYCFVFPNKRSGTFFRKYIGEISEGKWFVTPAITTISDFVSDISGRDPASRLDLLFLLYKEYDALQGGGVDFDKFRMWGEMVLSDFNDVDMYEADAEALFTNLYNINNLRSDYLTEDQLEVLSQYFGVKDRVRKEREESTRSFWIHYNNPAIPNDSSEHKKRFIELWEVLAELYKNFNRRLDELGLAYSGRIYRLAKEKVKEEGRDAVPGVRKVIMVGFNALSTVEFNLFRELQKLTVSASNGTTEAFADFYWDCTGVPMSDERNPAVHFVRKNIKKFPSSLDISSSDCMELPERLSVYSAPSNSGQAKIITDIVNEIRNRIGDDIIRDAKVAVVLPDEGLLLPVMYSIPEDMPGVNLTMGYPMSLTSTVTFIELLRKLQRRKRKGKDGKYEFFHEDVITLLTHAFVQSVVGPEVTMSLKDSIAKAHAFLIEEERIIGHSKSLAVFFRPLERDASYEEVLGYIDSALGEVESRMTLNAGVAFIKNRLDLSHIRLYRQSIKRLSDALREYGIDSRGESVFSLADGLIRGESVRFEGEPLEGLQIMGPLETRCLDFDYIIIPSMNERIYPRRLRNRSFIPNNLRKGFGIATTRFQESIFAYNFYRMISRAKEVYMIYDARSKGLKSGDMSRYIRQLSLLYAPGKVSIKPYTFRISKSDESITVKKTPDVMAGIDKYFLSGTGKYFSASALNNYIECPLRFYLQNVMGLTVNNEPEEFMEAYVLGLILHYVLENIYTPGNEEKECFLNPPKNITSSYLDKVLEDNVWLESLIRHGINKFYYNRSDDRLDEPLAADGEAYMNIFMQIIRRTLEYDRSITPFLYYGSEIKEKIEYKVSDGSVANMKMVIDRLDGATDSDSGKYRIVDYKSGHFNIEAASPDDLFDGDKENKAFFQLMLYAVLLHQTLHLPDGEGIGMAIYNLTQIGTDKDTKGVSRPKTGEKTGKEEVDSHIKIADTFRDKLDHLLLEIKNPEVDFGQCANSDNCKYCAFKNICRR